MDYKLEHFLNDPNADLGTGLLVTRGFGYCFTLKQPERWGKTETGIQTLPFGGIGGKLELGELPGASLHREALEEVGSDVEIQQDGHEAILMDVDSINTMNLSTDLPDEPLPLIIFRSPRAEQGRKSFTNVLIYAGRFTTNSIKPLDDPAIVEVGAELLMRMAENQMTVREFEQAGGRLTTRIELPPEGILRPIGTAIAVTRYLRAGLITELPT
jgi:hypothetical protein